MLHLLVLDILTLMTHGISLQSAIADIYNNSHVRARRGSCRVRSPREAVNGPWSGGSMTESFVLDDVEYKLCRYQVTWDEAQVFCSTHKSHLATLDNEEKASFVVEAIAASGLDFILAVSSYIDSFMQVGEGYWIGAKKYYGDLWIWDSSSKVLGTTINIIDNIEISYPGGENNDVHCLTIDRTGHNVPIFVPRICDQRRSFVCQRDSDRAFDNKMRMVAASRIGDQEFRLYSGKTTWAEAVVQCRQEGLQIAEVNTVEEARILAVSMLRNRPVGIESAWIGGYTRKSEPGTWRWLGSGKKIKDNEMRQRNFSESMGNCLLLDRHLCEIPVYVEAKCDRKRDVICQKPLKERPSKKPIAVIVDGCSYWIGFYPLIWSEARTSCESVNASLVVLDSAKTLSHMMSLMLDNNAELLHIWTDGHRGLKNGRWEWQVNGEAVPTFGKSFVPWCFEDNDVSANEFNCLNLDRENLETPLVYGLSCNERQPYVCQPNAGACVYRANVASAMGADQGGAKTTPPKKFESVPLFRKDMHTRSGVTGTMPMTMEDYERVPTSAKPARYLMDDPDNWEHGTSPSSKNPRRNTSTLTAATMTSRFAFPSFPQFGIKVASALETTTRSLTTRESARNKKIKQYLVTSTPSYKSPSPLASKTTIAPRSKPSRIDGQRIHQQTSLSNVGVGRAESVTRKALKTIDTKQYPKSRTKFATTTPVAPETSYSSLEHRRTRKYTEKSLEPSTKVTKINMRLSTEAPRTSYSKSSNTRIWSFRRLTTPLIKISKKSNVFTSDSTTPYDAIDEDYYENYQTGKIRIYDDEDSNSDDEYDEDYAIPKSQSDKLESEKKKDRGKIGKEKSSLSSVAEELSNNMQIALMNMLKKGTMENKSESTTKKVGSTTTSLPNVITERKKYMMKEGVTKIRNRTEHWSIRPYYSFEGPMIVGLSEQPGAPRSASKIAEISKGHDFKLIDKTIISDTAWKTDVTEAPRFRNYSGNDAEKPMEKKNKAPIVISDLPPVKPNDASSLMQMGRYLRNKFYEEEKSLKTGGERVEEKFYDDRREKSRWPIGKYRGEGRENVNYYEASRRLYPRGNFKVETSLLPSERSKTDIDSWQEIFKISWPADNSTSMEITNMSDEIKDKKFATPVRASRSSEEHRIAADIEDLTLASFPGLKIPKLIKEVKVDLDQKLLRDYLVSLAKKVVTKKTFPMSKRDDWKDSWKFILEQVSRILDRTNFNFNGELVRLQIGSDDKTEDFDEGSDENRTKIGQRNNKFGDSFESRENSTGSSEYLEDTWETMDGSDHRFDENTTVESSHENNNPGKNFLERFNELDDVRDTLTPRIENVSRYDKNPFGDARKNIQSDYRATSRPLSNENVDTREPSNGKILKNWYAGAYANLTNSHILVAPAIVRPFRISPVYRFQPIMPQLHHRLLGFNKGFAQSSRHDPTVNVSKKSTVFGSEHLPRGALSRIIGIKYPKQPFPNKIIAKTNFFPFHNLKNRTASTGNALDSNKSKNKSGEWKNDCENGSKPKKRDIIGYRVDKDTISDKKSQSSEKNSITSDGKGVNDQGRAEIVRSLVNLTEEPVIVSLRMTMNPRQKEAAKKSWHSSELAETPRTVQLRLKFSGGPKNIVNGLNNNSQSDSQDEASIGETRKIFRRVSEKNRRRAMIHKLRETSRIIAMRNSPLPWKSMKSAGTSRRDRNYRTFRKNENEKGRDIDGARRIASLLANLKEETDELTLYFDVKLGHVATRFNKTSQKSTT